MSTLKSNESNFYLTPTSERDLTYELHATTSISVSYGSSVTTNPIEDGSVVTDNVVQNPRTVKFSGVLTSVSQVSNSLFGKGIQFLTDALSKRNKSAAYKQVATTDYISKLRDLQASAEIFEVNFSGGQLNNLTNCILTSLEISKDPSIGSSDWFVSLSLKEVIQANPAITGIQPAKEYRLQIESDKKVQANGSEITDGEATRNIINDGKRLYDTDLRELVDVDGNPINP